MRVWIKWIVMAIVCTCVLTGCEKKNIFLNPENKYEPVRCTSESLEFEKYYAKDGSSFFEVYKPQALGNQQSFYVINKEFSLIPQVYKNELIALHSKSLDSVPEKLQLTRLKDIGWSFGIFGLTETDNGYKFNAGSLTVKNSQAQKLFQKGSSTEVILTEINGKDAKEYSLSDIGTILGFEQNAEVKIVCMVGTETHSATLLADQHYFVTFEEYESCDMEITKNGYVAYSMPEEMQSGYYMIVGKGLFTYHDHAKGLCMVGGDAMDVSNYENELALLSARYQQRAVVVQAKTYNVSFTVEIKDWKKANDVKCVLQSPSGELYDFNYKEGIASLTLAEVEAGRWTMNIYPKNIEVAKILYDSSVSTAEAICHSDEIIAIEDYEVGSFVASYTGNGEVWGTVTNVETNEARALTIDANKKIAVSTWYGLKKGTYRVDVYHYVNTAIENVELTSGEIKIDGDIIIIEGD